MLTLNIVDKCSSVCVFGLILARLADLWLIRFSLNYICPCVQLPSTVNHTYNTNQRSQQIHIKPVKFLAFYFVVYLLCSCLITKKPHLSWFWYFRNKKHLRSNVYNVSYVTQFCFHLRYIFFSCFCFVVNCFWCTMLIKLIYDKLC